MKYTAFISYNSHDDRWAKWLQRRLEAYHLPSVIRNEKSEIIKPTHQHRFRIFRYRTDLNTVSLQKGLSKELDDSQYLIVVCSPYSAHSEWVGREIRHFVENGKKDKIIPFVVKGTSYSDDERECLNPELKQAFPYGDILGVNINDYGDDLRIYRRRKAFIRIVSLLIGASDAYNYLWNRHRLRIWETYILQLFGIIAVVAAIFTAWLWNKEFYVSVCLSDMTAINDKLPPMQDAQVMLVLDADTISKNLSTTNDVKEWTNLPGRFSGKEIHVLFRASGYNSLDTIIHIERNKSIKLYIHRDNTYGLLGGTVIDEDGLPLTQVNIEVEDIVTTSDEKGHFIISIPIERQRQYPHVIFIKKGYQTEVFCESAVSTNWVVVMRKI